MNDYRSTGKSKLLKILVEIQDITRFKTANRFAAFLGLTPSQYSTGEHIRMAVVRREDKNRQMGLPALDVMQHIPSLESV
jgi:transposase